MKKQKLPLLFLALPGIILIFLFGYLPLFGLVIAFKNVDYSKGIWASDWVGLKNFEFFFKSNDALRVTRNTLVMNALFIVFTLIVSVSVALFDFLGCGQLCAGSFYRCQVRSRQSVSQFSGT